MDKFNGKYPGPIDFIKTMATIKIDAPRGPVRLDLATKSPIENIYIKKVEKKKMFGYDKDELWNTVIKTYPTVSHVLEIRPGEVHGAAGLFARLPALQILRMRLDEKCKTPAQRRGFNSGQHSSIQAVQLPACCTIDAIQRIR